ncbi:uncharacterized protein BXZ73DRAFT_87477 [Epithele typhae]|uniref:uncharacterized protein n=1 Tax=Epithele typhae TaxID=378194 RepID=UPI002007B04D|nr:uncharacterized protein BXZ73DRAFT_91708 [Epithele typhae]XP_047881865.1 uncharacterized protein BXZ73DRAFT_87477 [Epithele typhae]KAH9922025.1 hypothetical protein BXZ73DRAFT_91708 [Epithele typhae]KAH9943041.1 hypothetical protein BXZ73DRAFT_87477 [Epithele typhae]
MPDQDLLKVLEAHGQQFLQSFETTTVVGKRKKGPHSTLDRAISKKKRVEEASEEEEWAGITQRSTSSEAEGEDEDSEGVTDEPEDDDDDFTYESCAPQPDVVVFSEAGRSSAVTRASKTGFMSSKVTKLTEDAAKPSQKQKVRSADDEDDLTNAQNDALLHRLVHTQLLSGSLKHDLDLTPAQRKKALAGRILEAAGGAKLGKGEAAVRQKERNRAAKHVRDGLLEKQQQRREKELEEAKQLGNYHPSLKALYDPSSSKPSHKRERGMKMGVGSFKDGILRLGRNDIVAAERRSGSSRGKGARRRGGKR